MSEPLSGLPQSTVTEIVRERQQALRLVAELEAECDVLRKWLRGTLDERDGVSKMEGRDWDAVREVLGGYRSPLAEPPPSD